MQLILAPNWFVKADLIIDLFSFFVLLVFFILSMKNYKLSQNKKTLYLGIGFLILGIAELAIILTRFVIYYDTLFIQKVGEMIIQYHIVKSTDILYDIGGFAYKFLTLLGLYILYRTPMKKSSASDIVLSIFFILLAGLVGEIIFYIFHITLLVFIILIINNYLKVYRKNKTKTTEWLVGSFLILGISHSFFIVSNIPIMYVTAQIIQLIAYISFLFLIISLIKYGNTKRR